MTFYIKNMFCSHCKTAVRSEFEKLGLKILFIRLGEVRIKNKISPEQYEALKASLQKSGFIFLNEEQKKLIEKIKMVTEELIYYSDEQLKQCLPEYLSNKLRRDYSYLSDLFFEVKNTSIENYLSMYKIEKAEELLVHYKLNLNEIALQLNYNSVASLTNQFREVSGFSPSQFQVVKRIRREAVVNV